LRREHRNSWKKAWNFDRAGKMALLLRDVEDPAEEVALQLTFEARCDPISPTRV
jgi:hypothetical protein